MSGLGADGTLTIGTTAKHVQDVNTDLSATEIDKTTRNSQGFRSRRSGLRQWGASFTMVAEQNDTVYTTLLNAWYAGTAISGVTVLDSVGHYVSGTVYVTSMTRSEPLDGVVTSQVTLVGDGKPTVA